MFFSVCIYVCCFLNLKATVFSVYQYALYAHYDLLSIYLFRSNPEKIFEVFVEIAAGADGEGMYINYNVNHEMRNL